LNINTQQLLIGIGLGLFVAYLARKAGSLSRSGAVAAAIIGGITFGLGGLLPAILLLTFFITSSLLSRVGGRRKLVVATAFEKGGERDYGQVFANGGIASLFVVLFALTNEKLWLIGMIGAFAAVIADTWATELGVLARRHPRLITTWSVVEPGTSGGVTLEGSMAGIAGAGLIGLIGGLGLNDGSTMVASAIGGILGATFDSILGATVQVIYFCQTCDKQTERHTEHVCGSETVYLRGWMWLSNDMVNFISSILGALTSIGIWSIIS
jgi:uncharacterized protein (TIGR00297 family)